MSKKTITKEPISHELVQELVSLKQKMEDTLGESDPLFKLLEESLKTEDLHHLLVAKAAFEGQPEHIKSCILNGWKPQISRPREEDLYRFLDLEGWEIGEGEDKHGWDTDEDGHVVLHRMTEQLEDSPCWPHIRVQIREATQKDRTLRLLKKAVSYVETNWEKLVR
jgi:hypothetical protein